MVLLGCIYAQRCDNYSLSPSNKVHQKVGRGRGFYREHRDYDEKYNGLTKISREEFIASGGIHKKDNTNEIMIGRKWIFLSGSLAGRSLTLVLTAIF